MKSFEMKKKTNRNQWLRFSCGTKIQWKTPFPDNKQQHQAFLPPKKKKKQNKYLYSLHAVTDERFFAIIFIVIFIIAKHFHLSVFPLLFYKFLTTIRQHECSHFVVLLFQLKRQQIPFALDPKSLFRVVSRLLFSGSNWKKIGDKKRFSATHWNGGCWMCNASILHSYDDGSVMMVMTMIWMWNKSMAVSIFLHWICVLCRASRMDGSCRAFDIWWKRGFLVNMLCLPSNSLNMLYKIIIQW